VTMNASRTVTVNASTLTVGGVIGDGGSGFGLTKSGAGALILSGANTYSGATTINNGVLSIGTAQNLGTTTGGGNLIFNGGTLQITGTAITNFAALSRTVVFNSGATVGLDINNAGNTFTQDQLFNQGAGGLVKAGAGTLVINMANTYTGATTIGAGTLRLDDGGVISTLPMLNNGTLLINKSGTVTLGTDIPAVISGTGALVYSGGGTLVLNAPTYYTGVTKATSGNIILSDALAIQYSAIDTTGAGTFTLSGVTTPTFGGLSGASGDLATVIGSGYSGVTALTLNPQSGITYTYGGVIADGATGMTVTKTGAGTQVLQGNNTFTGTTSINNGTLTLSGPSGNIVSSSDIVFNGGNLTLSYADSDAEKTYNRVGDSATITAKGGGITYTTTTAGSTRAFEEAIGTVDLVSGPFAIHQSLDKTAGSQTLTLAGLTRTGAANSSVITFSNPGGLNTVNDIIRVNGITTSTPAGQIIGPWATVGTAYGTPTDYAVYNSDGTYGRVVAANIAASGESTWTTAANAYTMGANQTLTGARTITALRNTAATTLALAGYKLETYGLLNGANVGWTISGSGTLTTPTGGGNLYLGGQGTFTISSIIADNSGTVNLVKFGNSTGTLSGNNTYTGGTTINAGSVYAQTTTALGTGTITFAGSSSLYSWYGGYPVYANAVQVDEGVTATLNPGQNQYWSMAFNGVLSGSGTISVSPANNGNSGYSYGFNNANNTYTGTIVLGGSGGGGIFKVNSLGDGGRIQFGYASTTFQLGTGTASPLIFNTRQIEMTGGAGVNAGIYNQNATAGNTITIGTDLLVSAAGNKTLTLGGANTGNNTFAGDITDGAGAVISLTKADAGKWILSGNNTYTGTTTINGGVLEVTTLANGGVASGIGQSTSAAANLVFNNGALRYVGSVNASTDRAFTIAAGAGTAGTIEASGTGSATLTWSGAPSYTTANQARTINLGGSNTGDNTFSAVIANNGSGVVTLNKSGAGTWVLTANNTYTGVTTINAGTLKITGSGYSGGVQVNNGGTLSGDGTISGGATISSGAHISLYNASIDNISVGSLTLNSGSYLDFDITDASNLDQILVVGNITLNGGTVTINGGSGYFSALGSYNLIQYGGTLSGSGTLTLNAVNQDPSRAYTFSSGGGYLTLNVISGSTAYEWFGGGDNKWDTGNQWVGGSYPTGVAAVNFGTLGSSGTVNMNGVTSTGLSSLTFRNDQPTTIAGSGTLVFNNSAAGVAVTVDNTHTISTGVNVELQDNATITANSGGHLTISGTITGSGYGLIKAGVGTLTLSGDNNYTGGTTLSGGWLVAGSDTALGAAGSTITFNGGTLQTSADRTLANVAAINAATAANIDTVSNTLTLTGVIGGTGSLSKVGAGTLVLSGTNTYSGGTTVNGGYLVANNNSALGSGGATITASGTLDVNAGISLTGAITLNSGTVRAIGAGTGTISGQTTIGTGYNGTFTTATASDVLAFGAAIYGTDASSVINVTGPGTVRLNSGASSTGYLGGWNLNGSTLVLGDVNALGRTASTGTLTINNGTLAASGTGRTITSPNYLVFASDAYFGTASDTGTLTLQGAGTLTAGAHTLTVNNSTTLSGALGGTGSLVKTGTGILTLAGTTANTFSGGVTVNNGVLMLSKSAGVDAIGPGQAVTINGGTLMISANGQIDDAITSFTIDGGTFNLQGNTEGVTPYITLNGGTISGTGTTFILARGGYVGTGVNTISKSVSVRGTNANSGLFNITSGTTTVSGIIQTDSGGAQGITKTGAGTLILSAANTFVGDTRVTAGNLTIGNALALQSSILDMNASDAGTLTFNQNSTLGGLMGSRDLDMSTRTLSIGNNGSSTTYSGALSNGALTKVGSGILTLTGTNTYSGATTVSGGTLTIAGGQLTGGGAVNVTGGNATMIITNGGKVFSGGAASYIGNNTSGNKVLVVGGSGVTSLWNLGNQDLITQQTGTPTDNRLVIDGAGNGGSAIVTNVNNLSWGRSTANSSILLTNGARMFVNGAVTIGNTYYSNTATNNTLTIVGGDADSIFTGRGTLGGGFTVGNGERPDTRYNQVLVGAGGVLTNVGYNSGNREIDFVVGYAYQNTSSGTAWSNQLVVTDGGKAFMAGNLAVGYATGGAADTASSNAVRIANGGLVNAPGGLYLGANQNSGGPASFNSLTITNGGQFLTGANSYIGRGNSAGNSANNNTAWIGAGNAQWNLGGQTLFVGFTANATAIANNNVLTLSTGGILTNTSLTVGSGTGTETGNQFILDGGKAHLNTLTVGAGNSVAFNSGTLSVSGTSYSGGTAFTVGNGTDAATMQLRGGSHTFNSGLVIADNAVLTGTGTLMTMSGSLTFNSGSTFLVNFVGSVSDQLSLNGNVFINTGAQISFNGTPTQTGYTLINLSSGTINGTFTGSAPGGYDWFQTATTLQLVQAGFDGTWITSNGSGTWNDAGNWLSGQIAYGANKTATFNTLTLSSDVTVHLDGPRTIGHMTFDDLGGTYGWILDNNGSSTNILTLVAAAPTITVGNTTVEISAELAGINGLTKAGTGTLTLSGANSYSGGTTIAGGNLVANNNSALGAGSATITASGALNVNAGISLTGTLNVNGGIVRAIGGGTGTIVSQTTIGTGYNGTFTTATASDILRFNSAIYGTDTTSVINVTGPGSIWLNTGAPANGYLGAWYLSGSTLLVANDNALGATASTGTLTINNGTLASATGTARSLLSTNYLVFAGDVTFGQTSGGTGSFALPGAGTLTAGAHTFTVNNSTTLSGAIGGSGSITKAGAGTFALYGNNTYSGDTVVNSGTLIVGHNNALGNTTGSTTLNGTIYGFVGTVLELANGVTVTGETLTLNNSLATGRTTLFVNTGNTGTWASDIGLTGGQGNAQLWANGTLTVSGNVSSDSNSNPLWVRGTGTGTLSGNVNIGTAKFSKYDTGTWVINSTGNTWGDTEIAVGTLRLGMNNALPTTTVLTFGSVGNTATLDLNGFSQSVTGLTDSSGTLTKTITSSAAATLTVNNSADYSYGANGGIIAGAVNLVKDGAGKLTLAGANTYTGTTLISGGVLQIGAGGTAGALSASSAITNNATLTFNRSNTITQGTDFGTISGSGNVVQAGGGTLVLTANNSYTGATIVQSGALRIDGNQSSATGSITVSSGATLLGTGTSGGTLSLDGTLNPGTAGTVGTLTLAGATLNTGSLFAVDINGGSADRLTLNNTLTIQSGTTLSFNVLTAPSVSSYTLVQATNISGTFDTISLLPTGYSVNYSSTQITLNQLVANNGTFNNAGGGSWHLANNWVGNTVANGSGNTAYFNAPGISSNVTVSLASATTIGNLYFTDSGTTTAYGWTLSGGGNTLTLSGSAPTVTVDATSSATISAVVAGTQGLTKAGSGTLTLTGANTFSGDVNINAGTLSVSTTGNLGSTTNITFGGSGGALKITGNITNTRTLTLNTSGTIDVATGNTGTQTGIITGVGGFTKTGAGKLILNNNGNSFSGPLVITGGVLQNGTAYNAGQLSIPGGLSSPTVNITINGGILAEFSAGDFTNGLGSGVGQIQITGGVSGFANLQADRTDAGWLIGGNANNEVVWGSASFNPSTFVLNDASASPTATFGFKNKIDLNGSDRTVAANSASFGGLLSGVIRNSTGTAGIIKTGPGELRISNSGNTFNGDLTINGGILNFTTLGAWGGAGKNVTFTGTGSLNTVTGYTGGQLAVNSDVTGTILNSVSFTSASGSGSITLLGSSVTLDLGNASSFTGNLREQFTYDNAVVRFTQLGDGGKLQFAGQSSDSGQKPVFELYGNAGSVTLNTRQIELVNNPSQNALRAAILQNNNSGTLNTFIINTPLVNGVATRQVELQLAGSNTGNNAFNGLLSNGSNSLAVSKTGTGKWILGGANTFTGYLIINQGTLSVNSISDVSNAQPLGRSSVIQLGGRQGGRGDNLGDSSGILEYTGNGNIANRTFQIGDGIAADTGAGSILNNGAGALTFTAANFNSTISGITATRTLTLGGTNSASANEIQGVIQNNDTANNGLIALTKTGDSVWKLSGNNTYTGATAVQGGTILIGHNNALGAATSEVSLGYAGGNTNAAILIDGAYTLSRTIRLATANTTDPGTRVITLGGSSATNSVFSGNIHLGTANQTGRGVTLTAVNGGTVTFSGVIADPVGMDGAAPTVTKSGAGTVILSGANTYTGSTVISNGTLKINNTGYSGGVQVAGGVLSGTGTISGATVVNGGAINAGGVGEIGTLNASVVTFNNGSTFAVDLDGATADLLKLTDAATINSGATLSFNAISLSPTTYTLLQASSISGSFSYLNALPEFYALRYSATDITLYSVASNNGTWTSTANGWWEVQGNWTNNTVAMGTGKTANFNSVNITSDVTVSLAGTRTIGQLIFGDTGTSTAAGWTLSNSGNTNNVLTLSGGGTITVNALGSGKKVTMDTVLAGTEGLKKNGSGWLVLAQDNTYTGVTVINAGTLQVGNGGTLGTLGNDLSTITNKGVLVFNRSDALTVTRLITGNGQVVQAGSGTLTLNDGNDYSGGTILQGGRLVAGGDNALGGGTITFAGGTLTASTGDRTFTNKVFLLSSGAVDTAGNNMTLSGNITGSAALTKAGDGTLKFLSNANTYSGATIINGGTLEAGGTRVMSALSAVTINAGATLNFAGFDQVIKSLSGTGNLIGNTSLVISNNAGASYSGTINSGSVTVKGGAVQEFTSANAYDGGTIITNATVKVNNTSGSGLGSGAVSVLRGGTLGGTGTVAGAVTVNSAGHLAPGNSVGIQHYGTLTLNAGSYLDVEFAPGGTANDQFIVDNPNGLTIASGALVNLYQEGSTSAFTDFGQFDLINYTGSLNGLANNLSVANPAGNRVYTFGIRAGGSNWVTLTIGGAGGGWTGQGLDAYWGTASNWAGGAPPVALQQLVFDGNSRTINTNNYAANTKFSGFVFTNTAGIGSFVLDGNAINLVGNVVNLSTKLQTINLDLVLDGATRVFTANSGSLVINGVISETGGSQGLTKTGNSLLWLNGANTYTGATEIQAGAVRAQNGVGLPTASNLKIAGGVFESSGTFSRSLGTGANQLQWTGSGGFAAYGGTLTVNIGGSGATLTWGSTANFVGDGQSLIFGSASGNSDVFWVNPIDFSNSTRTVQVNGSRSATMEGVLSGSGGLTKTGGGKLILSANNTYTGDTLVNQGMLVVNGEVLSSAFTVNSRAFLAGTGTVTGEVDGGGTIAPGNSPGVLTLGAVDPSAGLSFNFEFTTLNQSDYTVSNDVLRLTSGTPFAADLSLTNTVNLTFNVQSGLVAGQTNWFTGGFYVDAGDFEASITGAVYNVAVPYYTSSGWTLVKRTIADGSFAPGGYVTQFGLYAEQLTVIPEPAVVLLWVAGGVTIFAARRRARRLQPRV